MRYEAWIETATASTRIEQIDARGFSEAFRCAVSKCSGQEFVRGVLAATEDEKVVAMRTAKPIDPEL